MTKRKPEPGKSLADSGLQCVSEWNHAKNFPLLPVDVYPSSGQKVWWKCASGHEWTESLNNRSKGRGCPYCSGRRVVAGISDLRTLHPKIYSEIKNLQELESTASVHPGSTQELTWKCKVGHEWRAAIRTRVQGHGCPFCSGKRTDSGVNDLASCRPDLLSEWGEGNPEPTWLRVTSNTVVSWICSNGQGHGYRLSVRARSAAKTNPCPVCNLKTFVTGENDLGTLHPELAAQWSQANAHLPAEVACNSKQVALWKCPQGHDFSCSVIDRVRGKGVCPQCHAQEIVEIESQRLFKMATERAEQLGGIALPTVVTSKMTQITFVCGEGHSFRKSFRAVVSRGGWCDFCRLDLPASEDEARAQLAVNNYTLLSTFLGVSRKVKVECRTCGLVREGAFYRFRENPCGHIKRSPEKANFRLEEAVRSLGGQVLSKNVSRLESFHSFRCSQGHVFSRTGQSVVGRGSWCPECGDIWVTPSKVTELVSSRGGVLLTDISGGVSSKTKLLIRCNLGHEFENDWNHMAGKRQGWCSICSKGSKSEEIARTTFKQLFGADFRKRRPKWLVNSRGRQMELDGYEPNLAIAFEYQGRQHFEDVGVYRMRDKLDQRKEDDQLKRDLCAQNGVSLVELRWDHAYEDFPELIRAQLGHRAETLNVDWNSPILIEQAFIRDDRLEELRVTLDKRQLRLVSTKWMDVSYRYQIECKKCGHSFAQSARSYFNSRGAAGCKKCAMRVTARQMSERRLGLPKLQAIAEQYSAKLISTSYIDVKTPYEWICNAGHIVKRTVPSIERSQSLCTQCSSKSVSLETLIDFARLHGGELVSRDFSKETSRYEWACDCGHIFTRAWVGMKNAKYFCPNCSEKKVTHAEMAAFAVKHSGKLLSQEVTTIKDDSTWECKMGHVFDRPFAHMKYRGKFICPEC